jgi:DNA-binding MarR family transcriptional regulator
MGSQASPRKRPLAARAKAATPATVGEEPRQILNSLRHIVRSLRVSSRNAERSVGLSGAQLFVLQCLSRRTPCSVNELAARTATDQSSVSVVVSRLVARGHVKRLPSKLDRRSVELSLTPSGTKLLQSAPEAAQERLLDALSQLEKSELVLLSSLLERVVELANVASESAPLFFEEGPTLVRPKSRARHARS